MNYNNLVSEMLSRFPELNLEYEKLLSGNFLDANSGVHTIFSTLFNPRLMREVERRSALSFRMMAFVAEMGNSDDRLVGEVAEFTVLEELCDEFEDEMINVYFDDLNFSESRKQIRQYIV